MAQSFFGITPVDVTPAIGAWNDVDCSAHIPAGATGVILHCVDISFGESIGLRKNGSTDNRYQDMTGHWWAMIGVDGSRIFEAKVEDITSAITIWLVGYTMAGVTFLTNGVQKDPDLLNQWRDLDCAVQAPSATGLIFEFERSAASWQLSGFRKNGSTDDRKAEATYHECFPAIVGCDGSQLCESYHVNATMNNWLLGYVTDGVTWKTNATDFSLGATGAWTDLAAFAANTAMVIIEVHITDQTIRDFGLRQNGSAENIYDVACVRSYGVVECDGSWKIEGKILGTVIDFWLIGEAEEDSGWTGKIAGVTNPASVAGVLAADIAEVKGVA